MAKERGDTNKHIDMLALSKQISRKTRFRKLVITRQKY